MAQSVIGALRVNLGLDSAQFQRGARRARNPINQLRSQFLRVASAATAMGAALSLAVRSGLRDVDRVAKAARTIDGTTGALRALELAAGDAGVSQSDVTNSAQRMTREIARAAREGGRGADALGRLGLEASALAEMDADERLATIADRIRELGLSSGDTMDLLRDLGVRSEEMALLMTQGGGAIRAARREVDELGLALDDQAVRQIERTNDSLQRIGLAFQAFRNRLAASVAPALESLSNSFVDAMREGGALRRVLDGLADNLQRIITYVGTAVAFFGARYVAALVAARVATMSLSGALVVLRGALIRTGVGAIIVGLGELIFWMTRVADRAGGLGRVFNMMADIGREAIGRLRNHFQMLGAAVRTRFNFIRADIAEAMEGAIASVTEFASRAIGTFQGAYDAIKAVWGQLPGVIGDLAFQAANSVVQATGRMLDNVAERINAWLPVINAMRGIMGQLPMEALPTGGDRSIGNEFEGRAAQAGADAGAAFRSGFESANIDPPETGLRDTVREASQAGLEAAREVRQLQDEFPDRWESVEALRRALDRTSEGARAVNESLLGVDGQPLVSAADDARQLDDALADIGGGGGGSGGGSGSGGSAGAAAEGIRGIGEAAQQTGQVMQTLQNGMANAFAQIVTGAQSVREALGQLLNQLANVLANSAFQALFGGLFGGGGGMSFSGALGPGTVPVPSFAGGGFTGTGARSGGLDGQGGFLSMLHPRETVIDHTKAGGQQAGGRVRIELGEGLRAEMLDESARQTVEIVQQDARQNFNRRAQASRQDPRRRG